MVEIVGISPDEAKLLQVEEGLNYQSISSFFFEARPFNLKLTGIPVNRRASKFK